MRLQKRVSRFKGAAVSSLRGIMRMKMLYRVVLGAAVLLAVAAAVAYVQIENAGVLAQRRAADLLERVQGPAETAAQVAAVLPEESEAMMSVPQRVLQDVDGYSVVAKLTIPRLELELPVLAECSDAALKVSVCRLTGPLQPGDAGNLVLTGHNYRSGAHFGRLDELEAGDEVTLMDVWGTEYQYLVSETVTIKPDDIEALSTYEGARALALLTCTQRANRRLLVRCIPAD
jgi:sortase A